MKRSIVFCVTCCFMHSFGMRHDDDRKKSGLGHRRLSRHWSEADLDNQLRVLNNPQKLAPDVNFFPPNKRQSVQVSNEVPRRSPSLRRRSPSPNRRQVRKPQERRSGVPSRLYQQEEGETYDLRNGYGYCERSQSLGVRIRSPQVTHYRTPQQPEVVVQQQLQPQVYIPPQPSDEYGENTIDPIILKKRIALFEKKVIFWRTTTFAITTSFAVTASVLFYAYFKTYAWFDKMNKEFEKKEKENVKPSVKPKQQIKPVHQAKPTQQIKPLAKSAAIKTMPE